MEEKIYIKFAGEVLLYCPFCGEKKLHMSGIDEDAFGCSECKQEITMTKRSSKTKDYIKSCEEVGNTILGKLDDDLKKLEDASIEMRIEILYDMLEKVIERLDKLEDAQA